DVNLDLRVLFPRFYEARAGRPAPRHQVGEGDVEVLRIVHTQENHFASDRVARRPSRRDEIGVGDNTNILKRGQPHMTSLYAYAKFLERQALYRETARRLELSAAILAPCADVAARLVKRHRGG